VANRPQVNWSVGEGRPLTSILHQNLGTSTVCDWRRVEDRRLIIGDVRRRLRSVANDEHDDLDDVRRLTSDRDQRVSIFSSKREEEPNRMSRALRGNMSLKCFAISAYYYRQRCVSPVSRHSSVRSPSSQCSMVTIIFLFFFFILLYTSHRYNIIIRIIYII